MPSVTRRAERERLTLAGAKGERGGRDHEVARVDAKRADGGVAGGAAEHDAVVAVGLDRRDEEAQGVG